MVAKTENVRETDWQRRANEAEVREMTPDERHHALELVLSARRRPVVVEINGGGLSGFEVPIVAEGRTAAKEHQATHGEAIRYQRFCARWGDKFKGSIIGRSRTAWQMHVCRLPVFAHEERRRDGSRPAPQHLVPTATAMRTVQWFRSLPQTDRWDLCEQTRRATNKIRI